MSGEVPPAAAARLLAAMADAVLLVDDGRVVRSWPDALAAEHPLPAAHSLASLPLAGLPLAQLVHPDDDLAVPPPPGTVARLRLPGGEHRWFEVTGADDPDGGCWLAA